MSADKTPEIIGDDDLDTVQGAGDIKNFRQVSQKGGGSAAVYPDVCKIPAPTAPFAAAPHPDAIDSYDTVGEKTAKSSNPSAGTGLNRGI